MANYNATSRTNTFRVKDVAAFKAWADKLGVTVHERHDGSGFVLFPDELSDSGTFPSYDLDTDEEIDFADQLSTHLAEGSVAVIVEAGAEKLRYVHGHAVAVSSKGEQLCIGLGDIYEMAEKRFGGEVTRSEY
jgi:hypothetical protein